MEALFVSPGFNMMCVLIGVGNCQIFKRLR